MRVSFADTVVGERLPEWILDKLTRFSSCSLIAGKWYPDEQRSTADYIQVRQEIAAINGRRPPLRWAGHTDESPKAIPKTASTSLIKPFLPLFPKDIRRLCYAATQTICQKITLDHREIHPKPSA
jgi:hypothetical protein